MLTTLLEKSEDRPLGLSLLVMGPDTAFSRSLADTGELTVGRAETADVRLADGLASRFHARIHVGPNASVTIEDMGSANGTRIGPDLLQPGDRVALAIGQVVTIGSTVLILQADQRVTRPRSVWSHEYFEARLEEECGSGGEGQASFAVIRLQADDGSVRTSLTDQVAAALRPQDVLAIFGPGEYEILLPKTPPELALAIADDLVSRLRGSCAAPRTGTACFPRDGKAPAVLLSLASERVRGGLPALADGASTPIIEDPAMRRLYEMVQRAAVAQISILIVGETGVGKEVIADAVYRMSARATAPFVCLNCAALTESLLESELFGHEKGAFTGAGDAKPGLLETAPGGTVFLDEIGEIPTTVQTKLLRVLESRQVTRVGGLRPRPIDVRFIAATNRSLERDIAEGRFRQDLYFRLNGITLSVPPLRERPSEILPLARRFLSQFSRQLGRRAEPVLSPDAEALLLQHLWPGNIRELRNVIERAVVLCVGGEISLDHLPVESMTGPEPQDAGPGRPGNGPLLAATAGEMSERDRVVAALYEHAGNQSRAARRLGIARSTLIEKIELYGIPRPRKPALRQ